MRKLLFLTGLMASLAVSAQKKETTALVVMDTAYIFKPAEIKQLNAILLESKVIMQGEQLTGKQLQALLAWIESKGVMYKKEQPKK